MKPASDDRLKVALLAVLVLAVELWWLRPDEKVERWFVPGALGHESGRRSIMDATRGFLSRDFSGGASESARLWERHNGKTASLSHGHNLATVFPASLYDSRPEFFPLVGDQRFKPLPDRVTWNPDLGRTDVAAYAADVAGSYFQRNPEAASFSLAINDAFIFGESSETLALIGPAPEARKARGPEAQMVGWSDSRKAGGESAGTENGKGGEVSDAVRSSDHQTIGSSGLPAFGPSAPPNRWFRGRPDYSNLVFTFMNRAADDLARTHPAKYLGALAYYWAENVPDFPVHPQVLPFLTADRSQGYDPAFRAEEFALQEKWAAAIAAAKPEAAGKRPQVRGWTTEDGRRSTEGRSAETGSGNEMRDRLASSHASGLAPDASAAQLRPRLGMYDYLDGPGFLIPRIHTKLIAENIRHAWQSGFTDYYAEGEPNWGLDGPMHWLVAQLLQDPAQPEGRLLDEYYRRYFQEAAGPMRKFFERCEEQWMRQAGAAYWLKHYRNESQAEVFPSSVCRELRGYLDEAQRIAREGRNQKLTDRVRLVSDAFGVTERFVAMQEARDALNRRVLEAEGRMAGWPDGRMVGGAEAGGQRADDGRPEGRKAETARKPEAGGRMTEDLKTGKREGRKAETIEEIARALDGFLTARKAFLDYLPGLKSGELPALAPFQVRDYTDHDPTVNALVVLGQLIAEQADDGKTPAARVGFHPSVALAAKLPRGWERLTRADVKTWPDLCRNGTMEGPLIPGRRIAGLEYGVTLPASWVSYVEPAEKHRAVFTAEGSSTDGSSPLPNPRTLRISGTTDTAVLQWNPAVEGAFYLAQVTMRGSVGPSCAATLTFGWLDAEKRNLGWTIMRLPEGQWSEPVTLSQGAFAPPGAAYVGVGVRIEHQAENDWVEVSDFRLRISVPE